MPFYEYQCRACGAQTEVLQKINEAPLKKCPDCGKSQLTKLISAPVFRLKGGGWYETDFKTDKDNKRNLVESESAESKSEAKPDDKTKDKAETKTEAKPEAKSEAKPAEKASTKSASKSTSKTAKKVTRKPTKTKARR
jgi:putative FmdB family regulatory protein